MRNILMTVMMIVVMLVLFNTIISDNATGTRSRIQSQGTSANTQIGNLVP
ncbi:hypothetical protein M3223_17100 [Paenibacillus pasadenensis]|nr:hypothetical protein [Paenibacillus pasadenensis]MCM3749076.1 hypothetical protein [Paenibacillus pasadenensis]